MTPISNEVSINLRNISSSEKIILFDNESPANITIDITLSNIHFENGFGVTVAFINEQKEYFTITCFPNWLLGFAPVGLNRSESELRGDFECSEIKVSYRSIAGIEDNNPDYVNAIILVKKFSNENEKEKWYEEADNYGNQN